MSDPAENPVFDSTLDTATAVQLAVLNQRLVPLIELTRQHEITLRGEKGDAGLVGDVNDLKGGMGTIRKLSWLAVGSGVGTFVTLLATHIRLQAP